MRQRAFSRPVPITTTTNLPLGDRELEKSLPRTPLSPTLEAELRRSCKALIAPSPHVHAPPPARRTTTKSQPKKSVPIAIARPKNQYASSSSNSSGISSSHTTTAALDSEDNTEKKVPLSSVGTTGKLKSSQHLITEVATKPLDATTAQLPEALFSPPKTAIARKRTLEFSHHQDFTNLHKLSPPTGDDGDRKVNSLKLSRAKSFASHTQIQSPGFPQSAVEKPPVPVMICRPTLVDVSTRPKTAGGESSKRYTSDYPSSDLLQRRKTARAGGETPSNVKKLSLFPVPVRRPTTAHGQEVPEADRALPPLPALEPERRTTAAAAGGLRKGFSLFGLHLRFGRKGKHSQPITTTVVA